MKINATLPEKGRDLRLDLFRGIANWAIFLDHIPDNVVNWITTRNYGFSDAADLFVFISGYTASFVYARMMIERGFIVGATRLTKRVWQLYVAHIILFVIYIVSIGYVAQRFNDSQIINEFNVVGVVENAIETLRQGLRSSGAAHQFRERRERCGLPAEPVRRAKRASSRRDAIFRNRDELVEWMPLVMQRRDDTVPVAATRVAGGTDVDFGALTRILLAHLKSQPGAALHLRQRITNVQREEDGRWQLTVQDEEVSGAKYAVSAKFVFLGAGGGALPLLQKSGIPEGKGFGGFPVSGQWLRCDNPMLTDRHFAKVYGKASLGAPPMSVPHLDTHIIDGKRSLLFGPFAGFTTKYLKKGSLLDLPTLAATGQCRADARRRGVEPRPYEISHWPRAPVAVVAIARASEIHAFGQAQALVSRGRRTAGAGHQERCEKRRHPPVWHKMIGKGDGSLRRCSVRRPARRPRCRSCSRLLNAASAARWPRMAGRPSCVR